MQEASADTDQRLQRALVAMRSLRRRVEELEAERAESVAIVGMACRFPGAADLAGYWQLLERGDTALSGLERRFAPEDLNGIPARAGLLEQIDRFDPLPFAMAPKEAAALDPQQRLLLEVAWEALENAGYAPAHVPRQPAGVFVGLTSVDFRELYQMEPAAFDAHAATGAANCFAAGRLAYCLGLEGPALVVDTACSSSLVAVHLAVQSLRNGECNLALAGGANILASPLALHLVAKTGALSPDGHCRAFDAAANGFVRGEGAGMLVLRRLRDALADGDQIWAVIRGSAVNQDGRSLNMTSPNGQAQARVLRSALERARVKPAQLTYVEAHGTGTELGDPIELEALRDVLDSGESPLYVGSVKSNIGHLEAAAGIAGLIKVVLAMRAGTVPRQPAFSALNPRIDLAGSRLRVPVESLPWDSSGSRLAGVSSFGMSGTNAHVILESAPSGAEPSQVDSPGPHLLLLSAKTDSALAATAARYRDALGAADCPPLADVCYTANVGRCHFRRRASLVAGSREEMQERLSAFLGESRAPTRAEPGKVVFLFTGQGSVYPGMGLELYQTEPVVKRVLDRCNEVLEPLMSCSLLDVLRSEGEHAGLLSQTAYAQPALFALEYAVAELWSAWGLRPSALVGHSVGECAAACFAGAFPLEDGLRWIVRRGALMQSTAVGGMLSIAGEPSRIRAQLDELPSLSIAAWNAPEAFVVSGELAELEVLRAALAKAGIQSKPLEVTRAFHSASMDPILDDLERETLRLPLSMPSLALFSNVSGEPLDAQQALDARYYSRHAREPVQFMRALEGALAMGCTTCVEVGPSATLSNLARQIAGGKQPLTVAPTLRRGKEARRVLLEAAATLFRAGHDLDWDAMYATGTRRRVALPTYPFERTRHWSVPVSSRPSGRVATLSLPRVDEQQLAAQSVHAGDPGALTAGDTPLARVARVVASVLHLDPQALDAQDSLRDLGLDSLLAVELKARLEREFAVVVPLVLFLESETLSALALRVAELAPTAPQPVVQEPAVEDERDPHAEFSLTELQQAYLVGRTASFGLGGTSTYFLLEFELDGVDLDRVESAFHRLIERHDMLRAVFSSDGNQRVLAATPTYRIERRDLRGESTEQREAKLLAIRREMSEQVLDASRWPLFDVRATRTSGDEVRLHLGFDALIVDAWSLSLLFREWTRIYQTPEAELPDIGISYRQYLAALQALSSRPEHAEHVRYWNERLDSLPPAPQLPLSAQPEGMLRPQFTRRTARIGARAFAALKQSAVQHGVSASVAVCAAYAKALARFAKSPKFTLNLLILNRVPLHPDVLSVVGNCSSTLLLEVGLAPGASFAEQARQLQRQLWQDLEHAAVSGVSVLRELNRRQSGVARVTMPVVFASTLNFDAQVSEADFRLHFEPGARQVHASLRTPQVWLDHQVIEEDGELIVNFDSVDALFPDGLIRDLFESYVGLLQRLADDSLAWTGAAPLNLPARHLELRDRVNETRGPLPDALLHAPFLERAARNPEALAVVTHDRQVSYGELDEHSERLAHWLVERGASRNQLVALVMDKGVEQVTGALAVLKSGAAYVPIDARLPPERLEYLLRQSQARAILTQSGVASRLALPPELPCFDVDRAEQLPAVRGRSAGPAKPGDLAYVIYTSGSTGVPKGVMIEHGAALNTVLDVNDRLEVSPSDRIFALSQFNFDLSVYDVFGMLAAGAALVLPEASESREPARWLSLLERERVTLWNSVPALMEMLADFVALSGEPAPLALRHVMLSGDSIPVTLPDRIRKLWPGVRCTSLGGATEASIWSIWYPIEEVDPRWTSIPYGVPMRNQSFEVLDAELEPRPIGVPGELYIGGVGLARGYFGDASKTAASFITHPRSGARLYKTGDLGRYLADGNIEFLGRDDFQVKISGHRVELGEVELALCQQPRVRSAVASAVGPAGAKRLIAYVLPEPEADVTERALTQALREKLPHYAVPSRILLLENLPLTANGKIDRRALPDPGVVAAPRQVTPPRTPIELGLAELWQGLLATRDFGVQDNFFALGGQSLLAVRLVGQIKERFGTLLPLSVLFEEPTIEALARRLKGERSVSARQPLVTIRRGGRELPWFFVHPVGGDVLCYAELAAALGEAQPFYALQTPDSEGAPLSSIEDMARCYERALRDVRPHGPYRLGGWSMGGVVAFELAARLREAGEEVESLMLVDITMPPRGDRAKLDEAWFLAAFTRDLGGLTHAEMSLEAAELSALDEQARWSRVASSLRNGRAKGAELDPAALAAYFERFHRNYRAMLGYQARRYDGRLTFLRASSEGASAPVARAWCDLASSSRTFDLPGDHYAITQPDGAELVAEHLRESVRAPQPPPRSGPRSSAVRWAAPPSNHDERD